MHSHNTASADACGHTPFQVDYCDTDVADNDYLLARIHFADSAPLAATVPGEIVLPLSPLSDVAPDEIWRSATPVQSGVEGGIAYRKNDDVLFGHLVGDETAAGGLEAVARKAYGEIAPLLQAHGYHYPLRVWNYLPDINLTEQDEERYKRFCSGRRQALDTQGQGFSSLPAGTGIGSFGPGLRVYFLAAKASGGQVENPRQVSAFHYPPQYGRRSPAFSRAVVKAWPDGAHLYISGTASITGHVSRHEGDIDAQLGETLSNLQALIQEGGKRTGRRFSLSDNALLKIYVRHPADYPQIRQRLVAEVGECARMLFVHGDICRQELLLEIEALCGACPG